MNLTERIKQIFAEPPIDDSLCGLNRQKNNIEEELKTDEYLSMNYSEDEYLKSPLEREIVADVHNTSDIEKELYKSLRTKEYTGPKHMKKRSNHDS